MDLGYRRARSLLQSSSIGSQALVPIQSIANAKAGLLDVDLVHEHTDPSILRHHQHRPRCR